HHLNTSVRMEDTERAITSFQQALKRDPEYAQAYAGLAEAYYYLSNVYRPPVEVIPEAEKAARKALRLDRPLGEAHALRGLFLPLYHWDWPAAEAAFRQAVGLSPGSGIVHLYYGLCLTMAERFADSAAELQRAKELDPTSPTLVAYTCHAFYLGHEY